MVIELYGECLLDICVALSFDTGRIRDHSCITDHVGDDTPSVPHCVSDRRAGAAFYSCAFQPVPGMDQYCDVG